MNSPSPDLSTLDSALLSHVGIVREENQDSVRALEPESGAPAASYGHLYAVADGMGGYSHGGVASATALETFFATFCAGRPSQPAESMRNGIEQAEVAVY